VPRKSSAHITIARSGSIRPSSFDVQELIIPIMN
jgi:hypothetical protein